MNRNHLLIGALALAAVAAYPAFFSGPKSVEGVSTPPKGDALVSIHVPAIEGNAAEGQRIFDTSCVACHGSNAVGVEGAGPPLIHVIYEPSHHSDEAFQRAVANGVRSHHWTFGNMPPVGGLTREDVAMVIDYTRQIQRANGIN